MRAEHADATLFWKNAKTEVRRDAKMVSSESECAKATSFLEDCECSSCHSETGAFSVTHNYADGPNLRKLVPSTRLGPSIAHGIKAVQVINNATICTVMSNAAVGIVPLLVRVMSLTG